MNKYSMYRFSRLVNFLNVYSWKTHQLVSDINFKIIYSFGKMFSVFFFHICVTTLFYSHFLYFITYNKLTIY